MKNGPGWTFGSTRGTTPGPGRGTENASETVSFLLKVTFAHVVTYFLVGTVAATLLNYESLFAEPIVREYMKEFGSVAMFVGTIVQVVRGLIVAAVLLPRWCIQVDGEGCATSLNRSDGSRSRVAIDRTRGTSDFTYCLGAHV